jgi:hypothetical protein
VSAEVYFCLSLLRQARSAHVAIEAKCGKAKF